EKFDPQKVRDLFRELEFHNLLKRLETVERIYGKYTPQDGEQLSFFAVDVGTQLEKSKNASSINVEIIDSEIGLNALVKRLNKADVIAFDTETTSTDQMAADLVGISLAINEDIGYYIPVGHKPEFGKQLSAERVLEALRPALTSPDIPKVGHNIKYDYVVLARHGLEVSPLSFDTMLAEWVVNPDSRNLGLKKLAWVRLNHQMTKIEELIGKGKSQITMAEVPIQKAAAYAADDAVVTFRLMPILEEELERVDSRQLFDELEMPAVPILAQMEINGIRLNKDFLVEMSSRLEISMAKTEAQILGAVGKEFNLNSPQQLSKALFTTLGLTPPDRTKKTKSGYYSTAAEVLEAMEEEHHVAKWVLEYRELSKLKSTYVDALVEQIHPLTKRIHTSYNQAGAVTGRIASSNPNLQNIPIRTEMGRQVRKAFVASQGWQLIAIDYSQIELRVVAHMAQDEAMLRAFNAGQDIHTTTAASVYGVSLEDVTKKQRRHAKAINFGLIYGMSPYGLTRTTGLTLAEAEDFVEAYFERFPGIERYLDHIREQAKAQGYVETMLGRRRYFPRLKATSNHNIRQREEREAINAPIQGTAADIMKIAMIHVAQALSKSNLSARILLQVHDELVIESPLEEVGETVRLVQSTMEAAYRLDIPLKTDAHCGSDWGSLKACSD
ncbi:MAG: DNA polymerase I, partial [Chloroflexota bacterium]|nr:DNA polymerase I [Chloroflexota bacterium]